MADLLETHIKEIEDEYRERKIFDKKEAEKGGKIKRKPGGRAAFLIETSYLTILESRSDWMAIQVITFLESILGQGKPIATDTMIKLTQKIRE